MPEMLHLKPEEVDAPEKRSKYNVCVVGCNQFGVAIAFMFVDAGFRVVCVDADQNLVKRLTKGKGPFVQRRTEPRLQSYVRAGTLHATHDLQAVVAHSDVVVLPGILKVDEKGNADFSELEKNCKQIGVNLQRGALVLFAGAAGFGSTEGMVKEMLEAASGFKVGQDFVLAYVTTQAPESSLTGEKELLVAADDRASLTAATTLLSTMTKKGILQVESTRIAELATLFAFARNEAEVALTNELAVLCENAKVDYLEMLKLVKPEYCESNFAPTIDWAKIEPWTQCLQETAENLGVRLRLLDLARRVNQDAVRHAVSLAQDVLRDCGKTLRRSRVALLGETGPGTSGERFLKMLEAKGARISRYDPDGDESEKSEIMHSARRTLIEAVENCDCVVIVTAEDQFKRLNLKNFRATMKLPAAIVDLAGILDAGRVRGEGFLYRGLGRGFDKE